VLACNTEKPPDSSCSCSTRRSFLVFHYQNAVRHVLVAAGNTLPRRAGFHQIAAAVLVDDFGYDRQSQSHAVALGREERVEDALQVLGSIPEPRSITEI
jgi:hypothetical protein